MVCDDEKCLPPDYIPFEFNLAAASPSKELQSAPENTTTTPDTETSAPAESPGILQPVQWKFGYQKLDNGNYNLRLEAALEEGWHLYSQTLPSDDGPVATEIAFELPEGIEKVGATMEEGKLIKDYDPNFEMELAFYENTVVFTQEIKAPDGKGIIKGEVYYMVCDAEKCLPPEAIPFEISLSTNAQIVETPAANEAEIDQSVIGIFIAGFLGGLLALLTPCVFPMIPLTVSFFTKQSPTKAKGISNAVMYGAFIIFIYTVLGFLTTWFFGADALNALSTNFWFNLAFFLLFTVFAISFFGAFEITLPSGWVNAVDRRADKGGFLGIFFMAFTLSLVSFSCTGPIIGTLLVEAAVRGGVLGPVMGMFGFSVALALPFGLFAAFPGWLNSMPKSGGWLNSVKVVLGFLELALALKFLSNADLVVQAGYITREVFIALWIAIFAMLTLYLLGAFRLPHDSKMEKMSVGRMLFAVVTFTFTLYLIPGLWGAPLQMISGFPPPSFYAESPGGLSSSGMIQTAPSASQNHKKSHAACPHNLNCFHDYDEALAHAKEVNKPLMIDFTGWACVNCRKMEEKVWKDPAVLSRLANEVVLVSLYVDEKIELPEDEQYVSEVTGKKIKTIGNKWSDFQITRYQSNSQPYYIIIDHSEKPLLESAAYDPDIPKFIEWLDRGIARFKAGNTNS
ncbi:MAG: thioredoxin family protein [Flavobacteriales bacterium]|nr:thioredoxin family protein [Flavobacteriales bacterium]